MPGPWVGEARQSEAEDGAEARLGVPCVLLRREHQGLGGEFY